MLLHATALDLLARAFRPIEPGRLPPVVYTRLLKPAAPAPRPPEPPARPARASRAPRRIALAPPRAPTPAAEHAASARDVARTRALHPQAAASAAASAPGRASEPTPAASGTGEAAGPPTAVSAPAPAASPAAPAVAASPAVASSAPVPTPAEAAWPPSTRLSYTITGYWRGALHGDGALVWQRDGDRYELKLSGSALIWFSYTSIGDIDGDWLAPRRYEEKVINRVKTVEFHRRAGTLGFSAIPSALPLRPHVQDSASLFMQLAHLLTTEPQSFRSGASITFAVARPSGMTDWTFRITGLEDVSTGEGSLQCWHVERQASDPNELGAQIWLAPQLQNLPVQIRLQQSQDSYLLFTLDRAEQ